MKHIIRDYLTFNKRERNGIFVLLAIILLLLGYLMVSDKYIQHEKIDFTKFESEIKVLQAAAKEKDRQVYSQEKDKIKIPVTTVTTVAERFLFDPNQLSEDNWKKLGLTDKQIRSIKNYESKGGVFRKKEDVKKMYVISPELYASLEPYIEIPAKGKSTAAPVGDHKIATPATKLIELNSADSLQLITVKGIGPYYAKSIIRYRNLLGGFHSKMQLLEVWKFDQEKYEAIEKYVTVDGYAIKKININTCTAKELKHPYINWKIANGIINYRDKHGPFQSVEEVKKTDLLDEETFLKIFPYWSIKGS